VDASGARFATDVRTTAGPEFERAQAILVDTWRRAGIDISGGIVAAAEARDREARQTFTGMASRGGGLAERIFTSGEIGTSANRWTGDNRGGWANAEYDRLYDQFETTLDHTQRTQQAVEMQKLISQELPVFVLYQAIQINTRAARLRGPEKGSYGFGELAPTSLPYWNIQDWAFS
jgi:ABC-type transport system substrate-binding protein